MTKTGTSLNREEQVYPPGQMYYTLTRSVAVLIASLGLFLAPAYLAAAAEVEVSRNNGTIEIAGKTYRAKIDTTGNLHLSVGGLEAMYGGFSRAEKKSRDEFQWEPLADSPVINVDGRRVGIHSGDWRIAYVFGAEEIKVDSEGYSLLYRYSENAIAGSSPQGKGGAVSQRKGVGAIRTLILQNDLCVQFSIPFHMVERRRSYLIPTDYLSNRKERGEKLQFTIKPGLSVTSVQQLSDLSLRPISNSRKWLHRNGNRGNIIHFSDPGDVRWFTAQDNIADAPFKDVTYSLRVVDHYFEGQEVFKNEKVATVPAGKKRILEWELPELSPGFYYARAAAQKNGEDLATDHRIFAVDLPNYDHPLTRPDDFEAFWNARIQELRDRPFDVEMTEVPEKSTEDVVHYQMEITGWNGRRYSCVLEEPREDGRYRGMISGSSDGQTVAVGPHRPGEKRGWPEAAEFRRWDGPQDNNMLECIMLALRLTDYLRSRDDVERIYLRSASRGGPIQFINAALDPEKIEAVGIHVPTSAGISWMDHKYQGWGDKPRDMDWERWTSMAAYVDPVNHAPNLQVPLIVAYGIADDLSPPQGIEVMYQKAASPWKKISRDKGGHQFSPGFRQLRRDLAQYLAKNASNRSNEE